MKILTIGRNTFRENIRDKILYNLILFALLMILSSIALGQLTLGHEAKVIVDLGLGSISIFGTLIAIFIGISLVYKEVSRTAVYPAGKCCHYGGGADAYSAVSGRDRTPHVPESVAGHLPDAAVAHG